MRRCGASATFEGMSNHVPDTEELSPILVLGYKVAENPQLSGPAFQGYEATATELNTAIKAMPDYDKPGTMSVFAVPQELARRCIAIALPAEPSLADLREAAGQALRRKDVSGKVLLQMPYQNMEELQAIVEGANLGRYRPTLFKKQPEITAIEVFTEGEEEATAQAIAAAERLASAQNMVRDLVNMPGSYLNPEFFYTISEILDEETDDEISVKTWNVEDLLEDDCGGLIGVGAGSQFPPCLIRLEWAGGENPQGHVALVGKGITYDSGGMSLKPSQGLVSMKSDMAGAATVMETVRLAAARKLPVRVTAWLAVAENMLSSTAQRVDDIITMPNGKTVEVNNTDAEGRLVLADALCLAVREEPDAVIDIATLTGAQIAALGSRTAGLMGSDEVVDAVFEASQQAGESAWPMPLPNHLRKSLDSEVADLQNSGSRYGGMLVGGLFLKEFVGDTPWCHIDIAGPSFNSEEPWGYTPKGGTGYGVRTLITYLENIAKKSAAAPAENK
ncbi:leucyl aminopeptidase [Actinobaculum suis]|uniref:Probable cytosol aminopeptidase n=2 Tax=Actinobaculum suis TaxID=1657 RepID=A0A7Z8Y898_9ACTO|nr:leucyl aminopeptidase [Actinobaculum suis]